MTANPFSLEGKVAIVTGSGGGLTKGAALGVGAAGARVVTCSRTLAEVEAAAGYPIDFLPDLEIFYRDWLGRTLPSDGAESNAGIEHQGDSV